MPAGTGPVTVYVDDMRARFREHIMCHMIGDTEAELHDMAGRIGIARRWYQGDHYDVTLDRRTLAVSLGAREITWRACSLMGGLVEGAGGGASGGVGGAGVIRYDAAAAPLARPGERTSVCASRPRR